jgi:transglutaminase-like putative cysteine protease
MLMIARVFFLAAVLAGILTDVASAEDYEVGARHSWVLYEDLTVPASPALELVDRGTVHLLFDRQVDVRGKRRLQYTRVARTFVDQIGLGEGAEAEISFEPAFQSVVLHGVSLIRNGERLDRLDRAHIHVVESDSAAADGIYDGSRSLVVLVPDVRVGDTLEYEYTTVGSNPVFGDHFIAEYALQWGVPVSRLRLRILADEARPIRYRVHHSELTPQVATREGNREWTWVASNVPARLAEDRLPTWFRPHAFVELSDFENWAKVGAWASELFRIESDAEQLIADLNRELMVPGDRTPERAAKALKFVQDEIRYLAVEIGANSHAPAAVSEVLKRRFGDCKDKSLLLATMLRELGVDARVALVSLREGGRLGARLASPLALDHAVVRIDYGDGRSPVWVDPSLVYQRGLDAALSSRVFGQALVIGGDHEGLEDIAPARSDLVDTEIVVRMELGRRDRPTWMRVDTLHRGPVADDARREIRSSSLAAAEKSYRDYYAALYPSLSSREPMRVSDDERKNEMRLREEYRIERFWTLAEESGRYAGEIFPLELANLISLPTTRARTMPLALEHPRHVVYTIRAEIDLGWAVPPRSIVVEDDAVRFERSVAVDGDELVVRYEYQTLAGHVPVEATVQHIEKLDRIRRLLAYPVSRPVDVQTAAAIAGPSALNWPKVFAALTIALFAFSFTALTVGLRYQPSLRTDIEGRDPRPGVGGWLNVVVLALAALVVGAAHDLLANVMPALQPNVWIGLTSADSPSFHPFWAPYLMYALVARLVVVAWLVGVIAACLRRSTRTPALAIGGLFLAVLLSVLEADCFRAVGVGVGDQAGLPSVVRVYSNFVFAAVVCVVTTPYLLWSRRASRTFGRPAAS